MCSNILIEPSDHLKKLIRYSGSTVDSPVVKLNILKNLLKSATESNIYIHECLSRSNIIMQAPVKKPRNEELEARVQQLQSDFMNKEYFNMVRDLGLSSREDRSLNVKIVNAQIAAVFNFAFTVVGSFIFSFKAVEYALSEPNIPLQVLTGIIIGTIVAIADLYFLLRDL